MQEIQKNAEANPNPKRDELKALREQFSKPVAGTLMEAAREQYGSDLKKSTQNLLERKIQETTDAVVNREYGNYTIRDNQLAKERDGKIQEAQKSGASMAEITKIDNCSSCSGFDAHGYESGGNKDCSANNQHSKATPGIFPGVAFYLKNFYKIPRFTVDKSGAGVYTTLRH